MQQLTDGRSVDLRSEKSAGRPKFEIPPLLLFVVHRTVSLVMFICAVSCPDPCHYFDGEVGIWRVFDPQNARQTQARRKAGDEYEKDAPIYS